MSNELYYQSTMADSHTCLEDAKDMPYGGEPQKMKLVQARVVFEVNVATLLPADERDMDDALEDVAFDVLQNSAEAEIDIDNVVDVLVSEDTSILNKYKPIDKDLWKKIIEESNSNKK
jgi:hypothetical protein